MNETINSIMSRKSIRNFTDREISDEDIRTILKAGMSGPTACNCRPWKFVVTTDRETMNKMAEANKHYADPARKAALAVLICGDLDKAFRPEKDFWVVDGAIAGQNMIIAAQSLGIGSCWLGVWPVDTRVKAQKDTLELPDNLVPHSLIVFGYPAEKENFGTPVKKPDFDEDSVTFIK